LKILSKRAQDFLISPLHRNKNFIDSSQKDILWDSRLEARKDSSFYGDNILTLSYFTQTDNELEKLFLEAVARLATERNIAFLANLSFREVENYLRDENHLPVFEADGAIKPETAYLKIKYSLLCSLVLKRVQGHALFNKLALRPWSELSLVEKNRLVLAGVELLNSLFPKLKKMNLALADDAEISLVMNEFPLASEVIELVFLALFIKQEEKTSLKVVAVQ
jgi:hypothetical protein